MTVHLNKLLRSRRRKTRRNPGTPQKSGDTIPIFISSRSNFNKVIDLPFFTTQLFD